MSENIPVIILCGGRGTRLAEHTDTTPKPMVDIGGHPILWHIMSHYAHYGYDEFILALGYKGEQIREYFTACNEPWTIHLADTGEDTLTGGRMKRLIKHEDIGLLIGAKTLMMTYGDGVGPVDIPGLLAFHRAHHGLVTLTAVRPPARFGALEFDGDRIAHFKEKSTLREAWINGGFFVIEPAALQYIVGDVMWEHAPMEHLAETGQLYAYKHDGFWQCMDTLRDLRFLESAWAAGNAPWKTW
jgi:glucose-1-phosphate cytidylyltransferase